jgi:predicted phosphoribosyltransferase
MDVFTVRKLGVPGRPELAMGALGPGGVRVLNRSVIERLNVTETEIKVTASVEEQELERREDAYRGGQPPLDLRGRTAILVDDGLATGATMRVAVSAARVRQAAVVVVAVPVAAAGSFEDVAQEADDVVCLATPSMLQAVGQWYERFEQVGDQTVRELLALSRPVLPGG